MNQAQLERPRDIGNAGTLTGAPRADVEFDIRRLYDLCWSGKWIILGVTAVSLFLATVYLLIVPPTYMADGLVQVEEDQKSGGAGNLNEISSMLLGTPVKTEAEIQVLKSRMVLLQVIDKLNLTISVFPRTMPIVGSAYFRHHKDAADPLSAPGFLRRYAWGGEAIDLPSLEVPAKLLNKRLILRATEQGYRLFAPDGDQILEGRVGELASATTDEGPVSIFVRDLKAFPGTEFTVERSAVQEVLRKLGNQITVAERGRQSGVIGISVTGPSAGFVAKIINSIEDAYLRQNVERRSAEAQQSLDFLEKQIPQLKGRVDTAQQRLNAYQLKNGSVNVTKETDLLLQHSVDMETQLMSLKQQREEALLRFTKDHPMIKAIDEKTRSIEAELQKIRGQSEKLPTTQQEILSLMRDLDVANELYTALMNSVQQLQIAKAGTVGNVRIVDYAIPPLRQASPKVPAVLGVSLVVGLFLGVAFVAVRRAMLRGVDDPAEVEAAIGLVAFASIPYSGSQKNMFKRGPDEQPGTLLALSDSRDLAVEALRSLRNSLSFLMLESNNNVVMLTGPAPNVGKSFIAGNLGALLSTSGKRVVVVDADLRLGHLNRFVALDPSPGLTEFVAGDATLEQIIRPAGADNLWLVSNGTRPPNPSELLMHERFTSLIKHLSENFDYVIVDTPPALLVADAAVVGQLAGCTLMVLKSAQHPLREIEETYRRLANAGVNVRGVVFNQVGRHIGSYGYGGYGYSYGYGYGGYYEKS